MLKLIKNIKRFFVRWITKPIERTRNLYVDKTGRLMYFDRTGYGEVKAIVEVVTHVETHIFYAVKIENKPTETNN